jgi:hypothetical protein
MKAPSPGAYFGEGLETTSSSDWPRGPAWRGAALGGARGWPTVLGEHWGATIGRTMSHAMLNFEGSGGGLTNHYAASSV